MAGLDASTYSNYGQAKRSFYEDTVSPLWAMLDAVFTRALLRDEKLLTQPGLQCWHDTDNVPALQEDADAKVERANKLFSGGLIMRNEARDLAGLDKLPDQQGDVFLLPVASSEVPLAEAGAADAPETHTGADAQQSSAPDEPDEPDAPDANEPGEDDATHS
jgi:hypothetical protein